MTTEIDPSEALKNKTSKAIVRQRAADAKEIALAADRRIVERDKHGRIAKKISDDQWDWVIERISSGDTDANCARVLDIRSSSIASKRELDEHFRKRYFKALESAYVNIAMETRSVARGEEGYSSGCVSRDKLIIETDLKLASKFASKILGDRLMVDQRSIIVQFPADSDDLM